ncbi:MAG: Type 1 glutamine amidotransferase-like domain-containing protein, partial [Candidatus Dormibacteria bacterium]
LEELPVLTRGDSRDPELARRAAQGHLFYLLGGDPGPVVTVLAGSPVWRAMVDAWRRGAVLAGSSAGAMGMCASVLLRAAWPDRSRRRYVAGLGLIPGCAVIPHFDTFGEGWVSSAQHQATGARPILLGLDERTAALWDHGRWRVEGTGHVTVIAGSSRRVHAAGDTLDDLPDPTDEVPEALPEP